MISELLIREIGRLAEKAYPREAVGALLGQPDAIIKIVPAVNIATDPNRFEVDPKEILGIQTEADLLGLDVVGWYHSHPDHPPIPTDTDRSTAIPGSLMLIISVLEGRADEVRMWAFDGEKFSEVAR